jgi:hypothetical protein
MWRAWCACGGKRSGRRGPRSRIAYWSRPIPQSNRAIVSPSHSVRHSLLLGRSRFTARDRTAPAHCQVGTPTQWNVSRAADAETRDPGDGRGSTAPQGLRRSKATVETPLRAETSRRRYTRNLSTAPRPASWTHSPRIRDVRTHTRYRDDPLRPSNRRCNTYCPQPGGMCIPGGRIILHSF